VNEQVIKGLSNKDIVASLEKQFERERQTTHTILLHLKEIQARKLYADRGYPNLFSMLINHFHQSESAAGQRLNALRLMIEVPEVEQGLKTGELNLSTLAMTQRQIRREEKVTGVKISKVRKAEIIGRISKKTMAQAEKELMTLLPESSKVMATHERRISSDTMRVGLSFPDRVMEKMERLRNHWAAVNPNMDSVELIERALDIALAKVESKKKFTSESEVKKSESTSESEVEKKAVTSESEVKETKRPYISAATIRALWIRAGSRCEYVDQVTGRRCECRFGLEKDHVIPIARGGSNELSNLRLLCRAHNLLMARRHFGSANIARHAAGSANS